MDKITSNTKDKNLSYFLLLILGIFGAHRDYLDQEKSDYTKIWGALGASLFIWIFAIMIRNESIQTVMCYVSYIIPIFGFGYLLLKDFLEIKKWKPETNYKQDMKNEKLRKAYYLWLAFGYTGIHRKYYKFENRVLFPSLFVPFVLCALIFPSTIQWESPVVVWMFGIMLALAHLSDGLNMHYYNNHE